MNTSVLASDELSSVSVSHLYSVNTFRWALDSEIAMGEQLPRKVAKKKWNCPFNYVIE
ncbi:MAG: hypothetical protein KF812_09385 [Fimbriimonadaceae bacterium]|nr:hypothetical protein [Fimbriimonadaceae bacterium]